MVAQKNADVQDFDINCGSNYETKSLQVITIRGAPTGIDGLAEEATAIDESVLTHRCILPWVFVYSYHIEAEKLKDALEVALSIHPVLSGRVSPAKPSEVRGDGSLRKFQLAHTNDGVHFVEASSVLRIQNFTHKAMARKSHNANSGMPMYCEAIDRWALMRGKEPLMKIKLTHLQDGGSVLAITIAHVAVDGRSFVDFVHYLAEEYKGKSSSVQHPFHNRLVLEPSTMEASLLAVRREQKSRMSGVVTAAGKSLPVRLQSRSDPSGAYKSNVQCEIEGEETKSEGGECSASRSHWLDVPTPSVWGAMSAMWKLGSSLRKQRQRFPKMGRELSTEILHIPEGQLRRLRSLATASCGPREYVSTNDCVGALLWTTICELRGKPLPGVNSMSDGGRLALAIDLRKNGLEHCVPDNFFGNASWSIQIESEKEEPQAGENSADPTSTALCVAARSIRSNLVKFREDEEAPIHLVKSLRKLQAAKFSSKVMVISETLLHYDVFMTSWQFPIWEIDFGCGGPHNFQGIMHPTPPFHAISFPANPADTGLCLAVTIPASAVDRLHNSPVLKRLAPNAKFLT
ncbi:hypothetical protein BSKO_07351 [Bryopsis sp. KO-2023]|nr:hypothetical protein BSKO_07351 [Bryopsis sp. KO-2023]